MAFFAWLKRRRLALDDEDFQAEVRAHLAMAEAERVAEGADPDEARYAALREFGNVTLTTEAARRVWTPRWLEALREVLSDARYGVRALAKHPAFALTVLGVLTLGIGLNAAVFTMLKGIAFSPLAGVDRSARLAVAFRETAGGRPLRVSYADYRHLRDHDRSFSGLMGTTVATVGLGRGRSSRSLWGEFVTGNYFQVLGVRASLGRTLLPSDEAGPGRQPVVVISDGLWRRDFGADPAIVGSTLEINDRRLTVVGVADAAFHGTTVVYDVEVYIPITVAPELGFRFGSRESTTTGVLDDRRALFVYPQGHLRPGVSLSAAAAQLDALWTERLGDRPLADPSERLRLVRFWQTPYGAPTYLLPLLTVVSAMGLLVLAIACANIAGLVLVRGMGRRGELAVRLALGATRSRIVRLLVVENLVLALPGALLGVLLASYGVPLLTGYAEAMAAPQRVFFNIEVDALDIGFAVLVACASALAFGLVPALQSSRIDLVTTINEDASPRGAGRGRLRAGLVVGQVAVSLLLLVGAGLVTRSLEAARRTDPGFVADHVASAAVDLRQNGYDEARGRAFARTLLDEVRADAGTERATIAVFEPLNFLETPAQRVAIEGYEPRRGEDLAFQWNAVGPDYFGTLGIRLLAGRQFLDHDGEHAAPVAMVNGTLATRFWGSEGKALGRRIRVGDGEWRTIVGVAADIKYLRIDESPRPYVYLPWLQAYRADLLLHTKGPAPAQVLADQARAHIAALDPDLPVLYAGPLADRAVGALIFFNFAATMLFVFGVSGMALAALGTYGLVSYTVRESTREIGIRIALGATSGAVVRTFLVRGMRLGALGVGLGVVAALAGSRLLGSVLYGVSATDPASYARALAIVLGTVVLASLLPAWRAAGTDPLRALRHQ